jgi:hypothetical protein
LIILYIVEGLNWFGHKLRLKYFFIAFVGICLTMNAIVLGILSQDNLSVNLEYLRGDKYAGYEPFWRHYFEMVDYAKNNVADDKIVMARKPAFVYLLTHSKSFNIPYTRDEKKIMDAVEESDYIILDSSDNTKYFLSPVIKKELDRLEFMYTTDRPVFAFVRVIK